MFAAHMDPFVPIRASQAEDGIVTSSEMTAAIRTIAGRRSGLAAYGNLAVGFESCNATQVAAIANVSITTHFRSKRQVVSAAMTSGRTPKAIRSTANEPANPAIIATNRFRRIGLGPGCTAWSATSSLIRSSVLIDPNL